MAVTCSNDGLRRNIFVCLGSIAVGSVPRGYYLKRSGPTIPRGCRPGSESRKMGLSLVGGNRAVGCCRNSARPAVDSFGRACRTHVAGKGPLFNDGRRNRGTCRPGGLTSIRARVAGTLCFCRGVRNGNGRNAPDSGHRIITGALGGARPACPGKNRRGGRT